MPGRRCMRGRPRRRRWVEEYFNKTYYKPAGVPINEIVVNLLDNEQLEAIRLVDLEGLTQADAAKKMGISRTTFWEELEAARKKIADALVNGKAIQISGGDYKIRESGDEEKDNTKTGE